jgi:hypothetical protein
MTDSSDRRRMEKWLVAKVVLDVPICSYKVATVTTTLRLAAYIATGSLV